MATQDHDTYRFGAISGSALYDLNVSENGSEAEVRERLAQRALNDMKLAGCYLPSEKRAAYAQIFTDLKSRAL